MASKGHKKQIIIEGDIARIQLTQGLWAIIDVSDLEEVRKYSWCVRAIQNKDKVYSVVSNAGSRLIYLHRFLLGCTERSQVVDHINGDPLDNRRENLRITTQAGNTRNVAKLPSKSGYRGLDFHPKRSKPWRLRPAIGGRLLYLGCYAETALPALLADAVQAMIADKLGIELSYRILNFPDIAHQTKTEYLDWLNACLSTKQLDRLYSAIDRLVESHLSTDTYVYLATRKDRAIKVGVSRNPEARIAGIRSNLDCVGACKETKLIHKVKFSTPDEAYSKEKEIHSKFSDFRIEGEWFRSSAKQEIISYLMKS